MCMGTLQSIKNTKKNIKQIPEEERAAVFEAFDQNMQDVFLKFAKFSKESPASKKKYSKSFLNGKVISNSL